MSVIRPECRTNSKFPSPPTRADALYRIREAVRGQAGLIAGRLHDYDGRSCAIGAFFERNPTLSLQSSIIDEVASFNDSIKTTSLRVRKRKVLDYLTFKLRELGAIR